MKRNSCILAAISCFALSGCGGDPSANLLYPGKVPLSDIKNMISAIQTKAENDKRLNFIRRYESKIVQPDYNHHYDHRVSIAKVSLEHKYVYIEKHFDFGKSGPNQSPDIRLDRKVFRVEDGVCHSFTENDGWRQSQDGEKQFDRLLSENKLVDFQTEVTSLFCENALKLVDVEEKHQSHSSLYESLGISMVFDAKFSSAKEGDLDCTYSFSDGQQSGFAKTNGRVYFAGNMPKELYSKDERHYGFLKERCVQMEWNDFVIPSLAEEQEAIVKK